MSTRHVHPKLTDREAAALADAARCALDAGANGAGALPLGWGPADQRALGRGIAKLDAVRK